MAGISIHLVFLLLLLLLGSLNTAKLTRQGKEVKKQTDKQVNEEIKNQTNGLNFNSLLSSIDIDLDAMAAEAEDFVRRFGVDENTLTDVKKYLHGNQMIASTAKSARDSLSKGKDMLRKVSLLHHQNSISNLLTRVLVSSVHLLCKSLAGFEQDDRNAARADHSGQ